MMKRYPATLPHPHSQIGFTLIEIMIVVVILGILAAMVVPRVMDRPDQARHVKAQQDIRMIESALHLYRLDNYSYPTTNQGLLALTEKPTEPPIPPNWSGRYIDRLPIDPWGKPYLYLNPGTQHEIDIFSYGADQREGGSGSQGDIGNWSLQ